MDVYCPTCSEPWEIDSIHDEVAKRFPNKPWYVEDKPVASQEPDKIENWCDFRDESFFCGNKAHEAIHTDSTIPYHHPFQAHISKSYKSWNNHPHIDPQTGLWYDDLIYSQHYEPVRAEFTRTGCATFGLPHNDTKANPLFSAIYDMMGDDMDGAASAFDDAERWGLIE